MRTTTNTSHSDPVLAGHLNRIERRGARYRTLGLFTCFVLPAITALTLAATTVAASATTGAAGGVGPGWSDNTIALVLIASAVVFVFWGRSRVSSDSNADKLSGLLMLGIVALVAFGLVWEISECAAGTHFGNPGDGSNPFDRFCPIDKTNSHAPTGAGR